MPPQSAAPAPKSRLLWSFREDVAIESAEDGSVTVLTRWEDVRVDPPTPAIKETLHRMTLGPVALTNVADLVCDDVHDLFLRLPGCVVCSLCLPDSPTPLLSATPVSPRDTFEPPELAAGARIRLSRFAFLRVHDGELLVESPLSHHQVALHRPLASWVVGSLARPTTCAEVANRVNVAEPLVEEIVAFLAAADIVVVGDVEPDTAEPSARPGAPRFAEDTDPALLAWSPHELLFHSRTRLGRHDGPAGAVFRHVGRLPPLPAVKPPPDGPRFPLYEPDLTTASNDMSLTEAIEGRRSVRHFADEGPSLEQLGELLYRSARVRSQTEILGAGLVNYTVTERPYPSAGSLYELDLYLTIDRCAGLPRGIYHYDPQGHALTLVNENQAHTDELLDNAMMLAGARRRPPTLITMTARLGRLSWVYDGISYTTALKHVGVLQQTLYLVATMLGLAPCALAMGDSEVATAAFDLDWPAEVSVGEFVVGLPAKTPD